MLLHYVTDFNLPLPSLLGTDNHPYASSSSTFTTNQQSNFISHSCSNSSSSLFYLNNHRGKPWLPLQTNPDQQHQHDNQSTKSKFRSHPRIDDDNSLFREHKIRIVERLGSVKTALSTFEDADETELIPRRRTSKDESQQNLFGPDSLSLRGSNSSTAFLTQRLDSESLKNMNVAMLDSISPSNKTQPLNNEEIAKAMVNAGVNIERNLTSSDKLLPVQTNGENFEWLDDNQLSQLSNHQLESLMDKLVMNVVKQLVQLASVDDDLKAEIDLLDNAGFSLLHYCCLYNLNSLVPVLLAKGANVDKKSSTGTAPLHLAAGSGHLALTQLLVECNATLEIYDSNNMLPSDVALLANQRAVYDYLYQVS